MNREIKFRAWDKDSEVMYYSEESQNDEHTFIAEKGGLQFYYIDLSDLWLINTHSILMQFTGLKDKNGEDIYEGDIVVYYDGELTFKAIVEWDYWSWHLKGVIPEDNFQIEDVTDKNKSDVEVIGNIWEHKELLEEKNE